MQEVNMTSKKKNSASALVWSPTDKGDVASVSLAGKRVTTSTAQGIRGTTGKSSGKWYFEFKIIQTESVGSVTTSPVIGIGTKQTSLYSPWATGLQMLAWYCESSASNLIFGQSQPRPTYGTAFVVGSNVGVALDMSNRQLQFYRNNVPQGILNLDTYTNGTEFYPYVCSPYGQGASVVDLFAGKDLVYPIPAGFQAW